MVTGKTKVPFVRDGIEEYISRLKHYIPFSMSVIPDLKSTRKMDQRTVMNLEGEAILKQIDPKDHLVLLDERGKIFSSIAFAEHLQKMEGRWARTVFLVGGAYGFSEKVYKRANERISLSAMTFSHQLVRLIFTEQLYRAYTIIKGDPYHHK